MKIPALNPIPKFVALAEAEATKYAVAAIIYCRGNFYAAACKFEDEGTVLLRAFWYMVCEEIGRFADLYNEAEAVESSEGRVVA